MCQIFIHPELMSRQVDLRRLELQTGTVSAVASRNRVVLIEAPHNVSRIRRNRWQLSQRQL